MSGFFSKLFGGKKKESAKVVTGDSAVGMVENVMSGLIEKADLDLEYEVHSEMAGETEEITVQLNGADESIVTEKEGALLDAFQLFVKRMLQHQMPETRANVSFDCNGFREEANRSLVELAEKLKEKALEQGRSVYLRALPPKDRKIVHQYLASDDRVRSRSVGDGLFKKIKIYPVKGADRDMGADSGADSGAELSENV